MARVIVEEAQNNFQAPADTAAPAVGGGLIWIVVIALLLWLFWWNSTPSTISEVDPYKPYVGSTGLSVRHVIANELNLREGPSMNARVTYLLTRNTTVILLGETRHGYTGEVWVKVGVDTAQGRVIGWVSDRYLA